MPRIVSRQERQEQALLKAIEHAKIEKGIRSDRELADLLGMPDATYNHQKMRKFSSVGPYKLSEMFRLLDFTGRQLAEIFGVPYDEPKED